MTPAGDQEGIKVRRYPLPSPHILKQSLFLVNTPLAEWVSVAHSIPLDFARNLPLQSGIKAECSAKGGEMDMWLVLFWSGPIGIGIFLLCLGGMIYLLSKADEVSKRTKAFAKEKELENK
jgi:hypothetical protein